MRKYFVNAHSESDKNSTKMRILLFTHRSAAAATKQSPFLTHITCWTVNWLSLVSPIHFISTEKHLRDFFFAFLDFDCRWFLSLLVCFVRQIRLYLLQPEAIIYDFCAVLSHFKLIKIDFVCSFVMYMRAYAAQGDVNDNPWHSL